MANKTGGFTGGTGGMGRGKGSHKPPVDNAVASVSAVASKTTVEPGEQFTVTMSAKNAAGTVLANQTFTIAIAGTPAPIRVDSILGNTAKCTAVAKTNQSVNLTVTCSGVSAPPIAITTVWVLAALSLSIPTTTLHAGDVVNGTVNATNQFGLSMPIPSVVASTSNPAVAQPGSVGGTTLPITTVGQGSAIIALTAGAVQSNQASVTVSASPATLVPTSYRVSVSPTSTNDGGIVSAVAQLLDQLGGNFALAGQTVTWSLASGTGGHFATASSVTDANGRATVNYTTALGISQTCTVRGTDFASRAGVSNAFSVTAASPPPPPPSTNLLVSNFASGSYAPQFTNPWGTAIDVIPDPTPRALGKVARFHYSVDAVGAFDDNKALIPPPSAVVLHLGDSLTWEGSFYLPPGVDMSGAVQRKLFRFGWDGVTFPHPLEAELTSYGSQYAFVFQPQQAWTTAEGTGAVHYVDGALAFLTAGVWHKLKVFIKINSSFAAKDGIFQCSVDGVMMLNRSDMQWSDPAWTDDPASYIWNSFGFGDQVSTGVPTTEDRYWSDDITYSSSQSGVIVTLAGPLANLNVGATEQLSATIGASNGSAIVGAVPDNWTSDNPGVLSVNATGLATAVAPGVANVTAHYQGVSSGALPISVGAVDPTPASVTVSPSAVSIQSGTTQLTATLKNAAGGIVSAVPTGWTSSVPGVATVSNTGLVTFVGVGTTNVQAHYNAIASNICVVTCVASGASGTVFAFSDFENGTIGPAFYNPWGANIDVVNDPTGSGRGKVCRIHYANNPPGNFFDANVAIVPVASFSRTRGQTVWFQGDFYIDNTLDAMRKLTYWGFDAGGLPSTVITLQPGSGASASQLFVDANQLHPELATYTGVLVTMRAWHRLRVQLTLNSNASTADGILRVWLDGVLAYENTAMQWEDSSFPNINYDSYGTGYQMQTPSVPTDEYRYWDKVCYTDSALALPV